VAEGAALELFAPRATWKQGEKVRLAVRLKNDGQAPLWFNRRMLLNTPSAPPFLREIWMEVIGPGGAPLRFRAKVTALFPVPENYLVLPPGEVYTRELPVATAFDFGAAGRYAVVAHYRDGNDPPPPAPEGAVYLAGELVSNGLELEIVAPA
jgi:hypothetical protein